MAKVILVANAPVAALLNSKPSLLLQEVQKDNLAQELFCKVVSLDPLPLEVLTCRGILFEDFIELIAYVAKEVFVALEKFLRDLFNVKGFFDFLELDFWNVRGPCYG